MSTANEIYEQAQLLSDYLLFHYGTEAQILPERFGSALDGVRASLGFPVRCVERLIDKPPGGAVVDNAYDLGCAVGRSSFELARHAGEVTGIDLSAAFIGAAKQMREQGSVTTEILLEGAITERVTLKAPAAPEDARISFEVGDAVTRAETLPPAELVFAANLLCRLPTPARFLEAMARLVAPGGQLLLITPFTWLESFTPKDAWPSDPEGRPMPGEAWIADRLSEGFTLEHAEDLPFLIREHQRKFQWTIAHGMRWRRRS